MVAPLCSIPPTTQTQETSTEMPGTKVAAALIQILHADKERACLLSLLFQKSKAWSVETNGQSSKSSSSPFHPSRVEHLLKGEAWNLPILDVNYLRGAASRAEIEMKTKYLSIQLSIQKGLGEMKSPFGGKAAQPGIIT